MSGCHRAPPTPAADTAAGAAPAAAARQALATLKKQFDDLQKSFADLGRQVEGLPADLPGYPQLRANYYAFEEARGVTDAKVGVLSSRLDETLRAGTPAELQQVSQEIAGAQDDGRHIGELYVKLLHQTMAFQRLAERRPGARPDQAPSAQAGPNSASGNAGASPLRNRP